MQVRLQEKHTKDCVDKFYPLKEEDPYPNDETSHYSNLAEHLEKGMKKRIYLPYSTGTLTSLFLFSTSNSSGIKSSLSIIESSPESMIDSFL